MDKADEQLHRKQRQCMKENCTLEKLNFLYRRVLQALLTSIKVLFWDSDV
jgi:hypothetical protein